jgi:hypothetical protein
MCNFFGGSTHIFLLGKNAGAVFVSGHDGKEQEKLLRSVFLSLTSKDIVRRENSTREEERRVGM